MCGDLQISLNTTSSHHHESNGLAETYVGVLKNLMTRAKETVFYLRSTGSHLCLTT